MTADGSRMVRKIESKTHTIVGICGKTGDVTIRGKTNLENLEKVRAW